MNGNPQSILQYTHYAENNTSRLLCLGLFYQGSQDLWHANAVSSIFQGVLIRVILHNGRAMEEISLEIMARDENYQILPRKFQWVLCKYNSH